MLEFLNLQFVKIAHITRIGVFPGVDNHSLLKNFIDFYQVSKEFFLAEFFIFRIVLILVFY